MRDREIIKILDLAERHELPDSIEDNSVVQLAMISELYKDGCLRGMDGSSKDGQRYRDLRITGAGRAYLKRLKQEQQGEGNKLAGDVVYNLIGPNARVNIQSFDGSSNIAHGEPTELFDKLRQFIPQSIADPSVAFELAKKVDELQQTKGTSQFVATYQDFIALAANHVTILAPFLPALSQMLTQG